MGAFFWRAWFERRDREYLYFAISTAGFAALSVAEALAILRHLLQLTISDRVLLALLWSPGLVAFPTLLHFALRYAGVGRLKWVMGPVYAFYAAFLAVGLFVKPYEFVEPTILATAGFEVPTVAVDVAPFALVVWTAVPITQVAVVTVLVTAFLRGRRDAFPACLGTVALLLATLHDAALGVGWVQSLPMLPLGQFLLVSGVTLTLVARYGTASRELARLTDQLRERSDELARSYEELKRAKRTLLEHERLATLGELAAVVAHEVRNPLAIVTNAVASLRKERVMGAERLMLLAIIEEEMGRLESLVGHLLTYARPIMPKTLEVDLRQLVERSLLRARDRPGVKRSVCVDNDVEPVVGDPDLLRQAFENVIANALEAIGDEGELEVRVERCSRRKVAVRIRDSGEGMSHEARQQALAPFFTTRPTGTGLGLPIVARIVEAHGGRLEIDSEQGTGTVVSLIIARDPRRTPQPRRRMRVASLYP
jgi:signal transduction histidine kinase